MKVGLFFGSFNPIHVGHLIIANHFIEFTELEEIWFVVSPQNPLKEEKNLLDADLRLEMVQTCIAGHRRLKASDVEFELPQPSYTINTLNHLKKEYTWYEFFIIMGSDSYANIRQWKDYKTILKSYETYVYQRRGFPVKPMELGNTTVFDFPFIDISATYVRDLMEQGKSIQFLVPDKALKLLQTAVKSPRLV